MNENLKKVTLIFNLNDSHDNELWQQLEEISEKISHNKSTRKLKKSDVLKSFIHPLSKKEIQDLQKKFISHAERIEIWCSTYNQNHNTKHLISEFVVTVMPTLKEKDYENLERDYFTPTLKKEIENVTVA